MSMPIRSSRLLRRVRDGWPHRRGRARVADKASAQRAKAKREFSWGAWCIAAQRFARLSCSTFRARAHFSLCSRAMHRYESSMFSLTMLGSGSAGNAALIATDHCRLLVDGGLSARQLSLGGSSSAESMPEQLDGVLLTHEHGDHVCGLEVLCRKFHVPIYCNALTAEAIRYGCDSLGAHRNWRIFAPARSFRSATSPCRLSGAARCRRTCRLRLSCGEKRARVHHRSRLSDEDAGRAFARSAHARDRDQSRRETFSRPASFGPGR